MSVFGGTKRGAAMAGLMLCLCCGPLPALAGESVVWNGQNVPGTTGKVRPDPWGNTPSLYPDGPSGNSVTINGDMPLNTKVYGGIDFHNNDAESAASHNRLIINRGIINQNVIGAQAESLTGSATATGNSVIVNGGRIDGETYAAIATSNGSNNVTATGNSLIINGGTVLGDVYGAFVFSNGGSATATGNSVTLSGAPVFGPCNLYGGRTNGGDAFSGNTLNVRDYTGSAVNSVQNFQHYNFVLPAGLRNGGTLLTVTNTAWFDDSQSGAPSGAKSSITGLNIMGGGAALHAGESVTLMRYATLGNNASAINGNGRIQGQKGVSLLYDFQLSQTATALNATVTGVRAHPQAKALSEGRLAGLVFVNQGAELIAGSGMDAARQSAGRTDGTGFAPFFAFQGGSSRYDTGSHVDVDGSSLLAGLAWNREVAGGRFLLGAFFEAGRGNYDSHNSFSGFASVRGDGDTNYRGGGVLGRFDFADNGPGNVYAEASFRAGWADADFSSDDLRDPLGRNASYDSGAAYYGAHLGLGYVWNVTEHSSLDLYIRYFWTRQDSDSVTVVDDPVKFKSADSHRWRAGARFSHELNTEKGLVFTPYIGAAWEHEFDGKSKATAYGYALDTPDLKGGTGIGELGVSFRPSAASGLSFDLAAQGYTGVRQGVSGSLQARWEF